MKKLSEIKSIDDLMPAPDNLEELLREAAKRKLSREERREQAISWVIGMSTHKVTREEAERVVDGG